MLMRIIMVLMITLLKMTDDNDSIRMKIRVIITMISSSIVVVLVVV